MSAQPTYAVDELVSVVVPAFNAERTLDETLYSIRAQSHRNLEILVVDDGSTDRTAAVAARHAEQDPRVRLVHQANAGVAAARNRGIAEASGRLVAPVDADDLWRPTKIARQVATLVEGPPGIGLVYCWSAVIDERGLITSRRWRPEYTGDVLPRLCRGNFLGNGSSALFVKAAALEVGGYDTTLRERQAEGCEDLALYLAIASRWGFALVKDFLVGYRITSANMSSNVLKMLRSYDLTMEPIGARFPHLAPDLKAGRNEALRYMTIRALRARRWSAALELVRMGFTFDARSTAVTLLRLAPHFGRLAYERRRLAVDVKRNSGARYFIEGVDGVSASAGIAAPTG